MRQLPWLRRAGVDIRRPFHSSPIRRLNDMSRRTDQGAEACEGSGVPPRPYRMGPGRARGPLSVDRPTSAPASAQNLPHPREPPFGSLLRPVVPLPCPIPLSGQEGPAAWRNSRRARDLQTFCANH